MKYFILILFFMISSLYSQTMDYIPLSINNEWNYEFYNNPGYSDEYYQAGTIDWLIISDSIYENLTSYKVLEVIEGDSISGNPPQYGWQKHFGPDTNYFLIEQRENGKYYFEPKSIEFYPFTINRFFESQNDLISLNDRDDPNYLIKYPEDIYILYTELQRSVGIKSMSLVKENGNFGKSYRINLLCHKTTSISNKFSIVNKFKISQNYPNPFNPNTRIEYSLLNKGYVELAVYNSLGEEVVKLVNKEQTAGNYIIQLDGSKLSSGVYYYQLTQGNQSNTMKMLLLK